MLRYGLDVVFSMLVFAFAVDSFCLSFTKAKLPFLGTVIFLNGVSMFIVCGV